MAHLYVLAVLSLIVTASEWMVRRTRLRMVGSALLVIVGTALVANLGALPVGTTAADPVPVYEVILDDGALLAVFWLLLSVRLRDALAAIRPLLVLFVAGAVASAAGVLIALWAVDGMATVERPYDALGGVIVTALTGGRASVDVATAGQGVSSGRALYDAFRTVYPSVIALWMVVTLIVPRLLLPIWPRKALGTMSLAGTPIGKAVTETEAVHGVHLGLALAMGLGAAWFADRVAVWSAAWGMALPPVLTLTMLALALARFRAVAQLQGTRMLGTFAVYLLLAVLGARFDGVVLAGLNDLGITLLLLVLIAVVVHGIVIFAVARWMRTDPTLAAVASQAGVGNPASALALARGLGRSDLLLPAVLVGVLGTIGGMYLGGWTATYLLPLLGG